MNITRTAPRGFTLVEIMVASALFVLVMTIATDIFIRTADSQSRSQAGKNVQQSADFAIAAMTNELKRAKAAGGDCTIACDTYYPFFCTAGASLLFKDDHGVCVTYSLETDGAGVERLKVLRSDLVKGSSQESYLTPASVRVTGLNFITSGIDDPAKPLGKVTVFLKLETLGNSPVPASAILQTTVTGRSDIFMH